MICDYQEPIPAQPVVVGGWRHATASCARHLTLAQGRGSHTHGEASGGKCCHDVRLQLLQDVLIAGCGLRDVLGRSSESTNRSRGDINHSLGTIDDLTRCGPYQLDVGS